MVVCICQSQSTNLSLTTKECTFYFIYLFIYFKNAHFKSFFFWTLLVVQWLRLWASIAKGCGSHPWLGNQDPTCCLRQKSAFAAYWRNSIWEAKACGTKSPLHSQEDGSVRGPGGYCFSLKGRRWDQKEIRDREAAGYLLLEVERDWGGNYACNSKMLNIRCL